MRQPRFHYHEQMKTLENTVISMGAAVIKMLGRALKAMVQSDLALCEKVIAADDQVDAYYMDVEKQILTLFALQTPVASDLRLLTALLHINLHLERVGDMAVNIAKIVKLAHDLPRNAKVMQHLEEMGGVAMKVLGAAMEAFAQRDIEACLRLPAMDDPIDRLNRGMLKEVLDAAGDKAMLEWGVRMHVVSRQIERIGDHAVDIAEQTYFLVTGEFREFTDASHPEMSFPAGRDE